jgi:hypothetical protein
MCMFPQGTLFLVPVCLALSRHPNVLKFCLGEDVRVSAPDNLEGVYWDRYSKPFNSLMHQWWMVDGNVVVVVMTEISVII